MPGFKRQLIEKIKKIEKDLFVNFYIEIVLVINQCKYVFHLEIRCDYFLDLTIF